jgi:hypothetical protein
VFRMFSSCRWVQVPKLRCSYDSQLIRLLIRQRNLNNAFAYDLVPSPTVIAAALKAARRVNDFPTAVRVFEGKRRPTSSHPQTPPNIARDGDTVEIYANRLHQVSRRRSKTRASTSSTSTS